jgi:hypothetical protein
MLTERWIWIARDLSILAFWLGLMIQGVLLIFPKLADCAR